MRPAWVLLALAACGDHTGLAGDAAPIDAPAGLDAASDAPPADAAPTPPPTSVGPADPNNPFFLALGTNGRACSTCHVEADGWTITPADLQARYAATNGADPIFALVDGANAPTADVSTAAGYSMLLNHGVIRVGRPVPAGAEFTLSAVDDPYGYATAAELSLYRRPLPSTNLAFLTSVMWDGREATLTSQATDATLGHAQAASVDPAQMAQIVAFESQITTAAASDPLAGPLDANGATGGAPALAEVTFTAGENDAFSPGFDRDVFALYTAWDKGPGPGGGPPNTPDGRRAQIARGERIFNERPVQITNVPGVNGPFDASQAPINGTCSTCHDTTAAGAHSLALLVDLGLTIPQRRRPDQPLYTFTRTSDGAAIQTTDPGLALSTGAWADLSKFKVPVLRGLALRAPYFHDGSAQDLNAVVGFYNARFRLNLGPNERADLVAFLQSL